MLLLAGATSNVGKTTFACSVVHRFSERMCVVAAKVTVVRPEGGRCPRGRADCGVCSMPLQDFVVEEERPGENPGKDTGRLAAAGAARALWVKAHPDRLPRAAEALAEAVGPRPSICESSSLRQVVLPDLFLMVGGGDGPMKPSAAAVRPWVDRFIQPISFQRTLHELDFRQGKWRLREPATLIVLAGGSSTRMGTDKGFLDLHGRPLIARLVDALAPRFEQVIISANEPGRFAFLGHPVVPDVLPGAGPLAGVAAALRASRNDLAMVVPCDLPEPDSDLVDRLLWAAADADGAVPTSDGRPEPLFAAYRRSLAPLAEEALGQGEHRIRALYPRCRIRTVEVGAEWTLPNLNTPSEYRDYLVRAAALHEGQAEADPLERGGLTSAAWRPRR